eukprot:jgi/Chrzof1/10166/Cz04g31120.t1
MKLSAKVRAAGPNFVLLGKDDCMIKSKKPVIAVTAVRTGCGKSQVSQYVINCLKQAGNKVVAVRHPMPYGDLAKQAVQRFADREDLEKNNVTIEEREEYEQYIKTGSVVYAGVDYQAILDEAEQEADVVLWDGGNNDLPFYTPDLWIVVTDPHRAGHESSYYPGDVNFRCADVIVINKANTAEQEKVDELLQAAKEINPRAKVYVTNSEVSTEQPDIIKGKKVVCVDDGPTISHGGMSTGAAKVAADKYGAAEVVDPRPYFKGKMKETLDKYPHIGEVVPAMGYSDKEVKDLEATINAVPADAVVSASPIDITKLIDLKQPVATVTYEIQDRESQGTKGKLSDEMDKFVKNIVQKS